MLAIFFMIKCLNHTAKGGAGKCNLLTTHIHNLCLEKRVGV